MPDIRSQQEVEKEPDIDPQQEGQLDATEGKDIADYDQDIVYEASEPKVELVAQVKREVDTNAEYVKMEIPHGGTLRQRMMPWEQYLALLRVHQYVPGYGKNCPLWITITLTNWDL